MRLTAGENKERCLKTTQKYFTENEGNGSRMCHSLLKKMKNNSGKEFLKIENNNKEAEWI